MTLVEIEAKFKINFEESYEVFLEALKLIKTDELREEGHVREMISKIQNMRKDKGFEVADKIKLYVADNDMLLDIVKKYAEVIKKETLTQEIVYNEEVDYSDTVIHGENLKMNVEVIK